MTSKEFVNLKLGDKNYTHSAYPMYREEIEEWLDEYKSLSEISFEENILVNNYFVGYESEYGIIEQLSINFKTLKEAKTFLENTNKEKYNNPKIYCEICGKM